MSPLTASPRSIPPGARAAGAGRLPACARSAPASTAAAAAHWLHRPRGAKQCARAPARRRRTTAPGTHAVADEREMRRASSLRKSSMFSGTGSSVVRPRRGLRGVSRHCAVFGAAWSVALRRSPGVGDRFRAPNGAGLWEVPLAKSEGVERQKAPPTDVPPRPEGSSGRALQAGASPSGTPPRLFSPRRRSFRAERGPLGPPIRAASAALRSRRVQPFWAAPRSGSGRLAGASRLRGYKPRRRAPPPPHVRQCPAERPKRGVVNRNIRIGLLSCQGFTSIKSTRRTSRDCRHMVPRQGVVSSLANDALDNR